MLSGVLVDTNGDSIPYQVSIGLNKALAYKATVSWTQAALAFLEYISQKFPDQSDQIAIIEAYGIEDSHWNWMNKSMVMCSDEYVWFYLEADKEIQAIAITYHPKNSRIDAAKELFYIEYLAVAPWNRRGYQPNQKFKGVGTHFISILSSYFPEKFGYSFGFALHSLPQACSYYSKIGMQDFGPDISKDSLNYFEMCQNLG